MIVIRGLAPNAAYLRLLTLATQQSWPTVESRLGACRDLGAVAVELDVGERTVLLRGRGWNPVFAIVEAAWVIAGRNDVKTLTEFIPGFDIYSDDGLTLNGAYGHRLRHYFGCDQLEQCIAELSRQPYSRRVVLSLYGASDLTSDSKDIPCNTQVILRCVEGRLEMTILNRSNDLWLGVPYNWFVFHVLQHLIASRLQVPCGVQRHVSSCLHLYEKNATAADNVVQTNDGVDLARLEANLIPLDIREFLSDIPAVADLSFDRLSSKQLIEALRRYNHYCATGAPIMGIQPSSDVLAVSLDRWASVHKVEYYASGTASSEPGRTPTIRLRVLRWISSTETLVALSQLRSVIEKAVPILRDVLGKEFGPGLIIEFYGTASQKLVCLQFLLQLVLGALEPELIETNIGDQLVKTIAGIAGAAGLPNLTVKPRRVEDDVLTNLFGDLLKDCEMITTPLENTDQATLRT